jgi:serine/threonine protein phosphatase PrpC
MTHIWQVMQSAAHSDIGLARSVNEDAYSLDPGRNIYVIADGLGGVAAGEIAATMAVEIVATELTIAVDRGLEELDLAEAMHTAFQEASTEIFQRSGESSDCSGMACSLIAAIVRHGFCFVAYAGDTRAYLFYDGTLHLMTVDDTAVAVLVKRGFLLPEKSRSHVMKNVLLKSVGSKPDVEANLMKFPVKTGDVLLLCSDGVWGMMEARELESILSRYTVPEEACLELVGAASEKGGQDNMTAIVVRIDE